MATTTSKTRRKKKTPASELIAQMEAKAPTASRLRELVKKYPAPQAWYDQADEVPKGKRGGSKSSGKQKK